VIRAARVLLFLSLALWTGGLATISFVLAPTAFQVAPSREVAGQIVGASLRKFAWIELACAAVGAAAAALIAIRTRRGRFAAIAVFVMGALTTYYAFQVYPAAAAARGTDPAAFAQWHRISVILVATNILLGTAALVCSAAARPPSDGA
jgi:uncharacterized membrane protein